MAAPSVPPPLTGGPAFTGEGRRVHLVAEEEETATEFEATATARTGSINGHDRLHSNDRSTRRTTGRGGVELLTRRKRESADADGDQKKQRGRDGVVDCHRRW